MRATSPKRRVTRPVQPQTPVWRKAVVPLLAFGLGALLAAPIAVATSGDSRSGTEETVRQLQLGDVKRDTEQVGTLTEQARAVVTGLTPVLDGLNATIPAGGTTLGPVADAAKIGQWKTATAAAVAKFADPPSAGTAVNIARGSLTAGAKQLDLAVAMYAEAAQAPADRQPGLFAAAARQRDLAVATWSVGATALDVLNVETGRGHQHVYLPSTSGQGAMTSDGSKEGS